MSKHELKWEMIRKNTAHGKSSNLVLSRPCNLPVDAIIFSLNTGPVSYKLAIANIIMG